MKANLYWVHVPGINVGHLADNPEPYQQGRRVLCGEYAPIVLDVTSAGRLERCEKCEAKAEAEET